MKVRPIAGLNLHFFIMSMNLNNPNKIIIILIIWFLTIPYSLVAQEEKSDMRFDNPVVTGWLIGTSENNSSTDPVTGRSNIFFDFENVRHGDYSVVYTFEESGSAVKLGITPDPFQKKWELQNLTSLSLWVRIDGELSHEPLQLALVDMNNNKAALRLEHIKPDRRWNRLNIFIDEFELPTEFNINELAAVQLEAAMEAGSRIWLDDLRFTSPENEFDAINVMDKSVRQWMEETRRTRPARIDSALVEVAEGNPGEGLLKEFSNLWLGNDLTRTNQRLYDIFTTEDVEVIREHGIHDTWSLSLNPLLIRMYYLFGSKSEVKPGRLQEKTEKALLELLWERTKEINDISLTQKSTWWLIGSENHDINAKASALLTSQIFMNEPEYADRKYPNPGTGGGIDYWFHQMYGQGNNKGPAGGASWGDNKQYTAENHYRAWVGFWNEYITERARKGFFLEVASTGYMRHSINFLQNIYDFVSDKDLSKRMDMFMDLIWAEWAQDQLGGVRGGAKTRWRYHGFDSMWEGAQFYLGGQANANTWYAQLVSDYEWPEIIWHMFLNRKGKGEYAYRSRKPGEEEPGLWPRPPGLERTMAVDTESRFLRYSWVTPNYILGTQMDHPAAVHSHLSPAARWQGISFAPDFAASISPAGIITDNDEKWSRERHSYYRSVQHKNVLITQQNRRWFQQNPSWYPTYDIYERDFGVHFSGSFDQLHEQEGWIFVEKDAAYLAVRPLMGEYEYDHESWSSTGNDALTSPIEMDTYEWGPKKEYIQFKDKYSPVIMEAGRRPDFASLEEFQAHIFSKKLELKKTVVPGWYIVLYGEDKDGNPVLTFNAANNEIPKVNGKDINYVPDIVFESPFLQSEYNSGIIDLKAEGRHKMLDFNKPASRDISGEKEM